MSWVASTGGCKGAGHCWGKQAEGWRAFGCLGTAALLLIWAAAAAHAWAQQGSAWHRSHLSSAVQDHTCPRCWCCQLSMNKPGCPLPLEMLGKAARYLPVPWLNSDHCTDPAPATSPQASHCLAIRGTEGDCHVPTAAAPQWQDHSLANNPDVPLVHLWDFLTAHGGEVWPEILLAML